MRLMKVLELMLLLSGPMRHLLATTFKTYYREKFGELIGGN